MAHWTVVKVGMETLKGDGAYRRTARPFNARFIRIVMPVARYCPDLPRHVISIKRQPTVKRPSNRRHHGFLGWRSLRAREPGIERRVHRRGRITRRLRLGLSRRRIVPLSSLGAPHLRRCRTRRYDSRRDRGACRRTGDRRPSLYAAPGVHQRRRDGAGDAVGAPRARAARRHRHPVLRRLGHRRAIHRSNSRVRGSRGVRAIGRRYARCDEH